MNVLVIEDEQHAATRLIRMCRKLLSNTFFHGPLESVSDSVAWLQDNPAPDLILVDIHLADGLSFDIFEQVEVQAPIVFTTAYDQYAIRAFKFNSIDYLLKPIEEEALAQAISKFQDRTYQSPAARLGAEWHHNLASDVQNKYKKRFVLRVGDRIKTIDTEAVQFAYSENKATYLRTKDGRSHLADFTLDQLEELLNPEQFFRINRKYISTFASVDKIVSYSNSRLRIDLKGWDDSDIVLSRDRSKAFKEWMDC